MPTLPSRLQLGSFDSVRDGWLSTDITPHLLVARVAGLPWLLHRVGAIGPERYASHRAGNFRSVRYLDLTRRFRFADDTFECVYASHVLEHLHPDAAERCLAEARRVLVPGGILRLAVPDLDRVVAEYDPADPDAFLDGIYQGRGRRAKRSARHWWHYNAVSLPALLRRLGFEQIDVCEYREGRMPDVAEIENRPWSLYVEAVK
ncbi:MAG: class I SAM-dependent methyltransferase [Solirubrobacteraceae bacterium]